MRRAVPYRQCSDDFMSQRGGKVVCVFDQNQARATRFGTQWGSRVAESLSRLLADDR